MGEEFLSCICALLLVWIWFSKIMTFAWHEDYGVHDTFERVAVIRPRSEVDKSLNYAVVTVVLVHNLGSEYPGRKFNQNHIYLSSRFEEPLALLNEYSFLLSFQNISIWRELKLKSFLPVDPYQCPSIHDQVKAANTINAKYWLFFTKKNWIERYFSF